MVIDSAYRSITTGLISNYTISIETSANIAYFPKATSIIAQAISGESNIVSKKSSNTGSDITLDSLRPENKSRKSLNYELGGRSAFAMSGSSPLITSANPMV